MIKNNPTLLYISRANSQRRKIKNEEKLKKTLENLGIITIQLENLSLEQQIKTIYNARLIISTHGAGLTNLIFAQPGTKVIEFIPRKRFTQHYIKISTILNLQHFVIKYKGDYNDNLKININKFELFLRHIIRN